ncbi:MAG: carbon monoxide dehydrogenase subunit G [Gammaproteobacteria bacterium]|nr:carbon monoxide dehydrogenase subunit G [Gammaproteobacteria bacterium]
MEQTGEFRIAAARSRVWEGLNDPDVLARCIDGCLSMERTSDQQFDASVKARFGPVSATFQAQLVLSELQPPSSYTLTANVNGGPAGFGKGSAQVTLEEDDGATLLRYSVTANVGGKLAQVGSRLIDAAARKMANDFFAEFGREIGGERPAATDPVAAKQGWWGRWRIWAVVCAALVLAVILAS